MHMDSYNGLRLISSRANPDYKDWLLLSQGKEKPYGQKALLEGMNICQAWLAHKGLPDVVISTPASLESAAIKQLWDSCRDTDRVFIADSLAKQLSQVKSGPAMFFLVKPGIKNPPKHLSDTGLMLDRVQDPGNLGGLLRTAAAAGIKHAYLSPGCAKAWSAKALRAGQGAHFVMDIFEQANLGALISASSLPVAATTLQQAKSLYDYDLSQPNIWLFGNEGQGLAAELLELANWRIKIPQDSGVESLNVAAAAAVCLFEQRRQMRL